MGGAIDLMAPLEYKGGYMNKIFKYSGNGSIEFTLPSKTRSFVLKQGETATIDVKEEDARVIVQLRALHISVSDIEEIKDVVTEQKKEFVKPDIVEVEADSNKEVKTSKDLMSMTAADLKVYADSKGVTYADNAAKKDIVSAILGE